MVGFKSFQIIDTNMMRIHATVVRGAHKKVYEHCFMKQKCQLQIGVAQYKNVAMQLSSKGINTTHQHFQRRYVTLFLLKGLKSYEPW